MLGMVARVINMDKKNLIIAFLLGALLVQPSKASSGIMQSSEIAAAIIKGAKIIGLGASCASGYLVTDSGAQSYWNFVKKIPEKIEGYDW